MTDGSLPQSDDAGHDGPLVIGNTVPTTQPDQQATSSMPNMTWTAGEARRSLDDQRAELVAQRDRIDRLGEEIASIKADAVKVGITCKVTDKERRATKDASVKQVAALPPTQAQLAEREKARLKLEGKLDVIDEVASDASA